MEREKTKMEAMLRSILDEILQSKLRAILSSILDAKLKTYAESMNFYNTKFETMKGKMVGLEEQAKTLAQENGWHPYTHTIPGLLLNQPITSILSKQTMVNSTFALRL